MKKIRVMLKNFPIIIVLVTVLLSSCAKSSPLVKVPDLRGYDRNQAADVLRELGIFAKFVEEPNKAEEGTVIRISPDSGTEVEFGSTVEVRYAIPLLHTVRVEYDVESNLWSNLPDGKCEHRESGVYWGQTVSLAGPDGSLLGSAGVSNGTVVDVGANYWQEDYDGKVCRFEFTFLNIPEVATYKFISDKESWPAISLDKAIRDNWEFVFDWGY